MKKKMLFAKKVLSGAFVFLAVALAGGYEQSNPNNDSIAVLSLSCLIVAYLFAVVGNDSSGSPRRT